MSQSQSNHRNNRRSTPTAVVRMDLAARREAGGLVSFGVCLGGDEMTEDEKYKLQELVVLDSKQVLFAVLAQIGTVGVIQRTIEWVQQSRPEWNREQCVEFVIGRRP